MNREIRDFLNSNNFIVKKIIINGKIIIIIGDNYKFVIKKKYSDMNKLYKYLSSRAFMYYPSILYETKNYYIYEYIDNVSMDDYEKSNDIFKLMSLLHMKTTYYKDIDEDNYKMVFEDISNKLDYLYNYYDDITSLIEGEEYMSPSNYFFVRNVSMIFTSIKYSREYLDKWLNIIKDKLRVRVVQLHNNMSIEHYLHNETKPVFVSFDKSKKDNPIYDIIVFYKRYYNELDFCDLLHIYEKTYPLLNEEKYLFFSIITIPPKIVFDKREYEMCKIVNNLYDYIDCSLKFISDYIPKESNKKQ